MIAMCVVLIILYVMRSCYHNLFVIHYNVMCLYVMSKFITKVSVYDLNCFLCFGFVYLTLYYFFC